MGATAANENGFLKLLSRELSVFFETGLLPSIKNY